MLHHQHPDKYRCARPIERPAGEFVVNAHNNDGVDRDEVQDHAYPHRARRRPACRNGVQAMRAVVCGVLHRIEDWMETEDGQLKGVYKGNMDIIMAD